MSATIDEMKGGVDRSKKPFMSTISIRDIPPWVVRAFTFFWAYALLGLSLYQGYDYAAVTTEPGSKDRLAYTIGIIAFIMLAHGGVHMAVLADSTNNKSLRKWAWILIIWGSAISIYTSTFMYNQQTISSIARENQNDPAYIARMELAKQRTELATSMGNQVGDGLLGTIAGNDASEQLALADQDIAKAESVNTSSIAAASTAMGFSSSVSAFVKGFGQTVMEMIVTFFWAKIIGSRIINLVPVDSREKKIKK